MTPEAVLELAERFEGLISVHAMHSDMLQEASGAKPHTILTLSHKGTSLDLGFSENSLETVWLTWVSGIMQQSLNMRENLCTGARTAWLYVVVPEGSQFYGRRFEIDGVDLGQLPESPAFRLLFWIDAGEHLLRIFDESDQPIGEMVFTIQDDLSKGDQYIVLDGVRVPDI